MAKWLVRAITICAASAIIWLLDIPFGDDYFNTVFSVIGIAFSVAFGLVLSFPFSNIPNDDFVSTYRKQLAHIKTSFVSVFTVAIIAYVLSKKMPHIGWINTLLGIIELFALAYIALNVSALSKLKDDIDDLLRKPK